MLAVFAGDLCQTMNCMVSASRYVNLSVCVRIAQYVYMFVRGDQKTSLTFNY